MSLWSIFKTLKTGAEIPQNQSGLVFPNSTIRQTLRMTIGAEYIRVRISNAFGVTNLPITAVTVAYPALGVNASAGASAILTNSTKQLTFSGNQSISIPNGALAVSDPIEFPIKALSTLTVTMYLANGQTTNYITSHPGSRTTSWFSFGDYTKAANMTDSSTQSIAHW